MLKNSHPFLKISFIFYFSYLNESNKLSKGIGNFGRVCHFAKEYIFYITEVCGSGVQTSSIWQRASDYGRRRGAFPSADQKNPSTWISALLNIIVLADYLAHPESSLIETFCLAVFVQSFVPEVSKRGNVFCRTIISLKELLFHSADPRGVT